MIVVPILKPGRQGHLPEDYRPIGLLSTLRKLFEKILQDRLSFHLERFHLWPRTQFGFRKGHGTAFPLYVFLTDVHIAFATNRHVLALFLDLSAAYDHVCVQRLAERLLTLGIPPILCYLLSELYSHRQYSLPPSFRSTLTRYTSQGIIQGSSLSPLLYALYVGDILSSVEVSARVLQYADDIIIYTAISPRDPTDLGRFERDCQCIITYLQALTCRLIFLRLDSCISSGI